MVMGQGDVGQLGLGEDALEKKKPFPVGGALEGVGVVQVVCGGMHTVALTATGKVGPFLSLPHSHTHTHTNLPSSLHPPSPLSLTSILSFPPSLPSLSIPLHSPLTHSLFILLLPSLPSLLPSFLPPSLPPSLPHSLTHSLPPSLPPSPPPLSSSQVYTWGCNDEGALGRDADEDEGFFPGLVEGGGLGGGVRVVQVSAGDSHTAALTEDGSVYCWGVFRVRG